MVEEFSSSKLDFNIDIGVEESFSREFLETPLDLEGIRNALQVTVLDPVTVQWIIGMFAQNRVQIGLRPHGNRPLVGLREVTAVQNLKNNMDTDLRSRSWTDAASKSMVL